MFYNYLNENERDEKYLWKLFQQMIVQSHTNHILILVDTQISEEFQDLRGCKVKFALSLNLNQCAPRKARCVMEKNYLASPA